MNNLGVQQFLQGHNFTTSYPRPPAIGEENEVTSTHSSISNKSEVSTATPRHADKDLGYEPEGSASPLPTCDRWRSSLRSMLEDSEGIRLFKMFLADSKRQELLDCWFACKGFQDFGTKNNCSNNSSAASSTTGPLTAQRSQLDAATLQTRGKLAKKIFNTYMKKNSCVAVSSIIKDPTRQTIFKQIKSALQAQKDMSSCVELDASLFDQAQIEIELNIEENSYVPFLKSDLFQKYAAQCESRLSKQVTNSTHGDNRSSSGVSPQVAPVAEPGLTSRYLPRLDENQIWHPLPNTENTSIGKDQSLNSTASSGVSQSSLARAAMKRNMVASHERYANMTDRPDQNHPAYPYFVATSATKYYVPPASANASDNASSDATSDTLSMTDGSVDVDVPTSYTTKKHQKRMMRQQIKKNSVIYHHNEHGFISLTRRCQYKQQNLATLATDNPKEFFAQLKEKLEKVVEERRKTEMEAAAAADNVEDILDSHLERVMKTPIAVDSPNRNQSPPPIVTRQAIAQPRQSGANYATHVPPDVLLDERRYYQQKDAVEALSNQNRVSARDRMQFSQKQIDSLPRRKEIAVGMAPNEVPDVLDVPAQPVDKNHMISEWIKQANNKPTQPQNNATSERRGSKSRYINRGSSFPIQAMVTSKASQFQALPLQPISQDRNMPPLEQPDASTTIEEVKRRLIEETERGLGIDNSMHHLNLVNATNVPQGYDYHQNFTGARVNVPVSGLGYNAKHSAFLGGFVNPHAPAPVGIGSSVSSNCPPSTQSLGSDSGKTTCIYTMPNEDMAYKIQIPHSPVTLGQFKNYLGRRGNFKYFFKQYSKEIEGAVNSEIIDDNELLPLWANAVVAKVKED